MKIATSYRLESCLCCGMGGLEDFLDFGTQPLGTMGCIDSSFESDLYSTFRFLSCPSCGHVQQFVAVDPKVLYMGNYARLESLRPDSHLDELALSIGNTVPDGCGLVVELGCGSGVLLQRVRARFSDLRVLGVDAAANCVEACRGVGINVLCGFFDSEIAAKVLDEAGRADVVVARHVLEHCIDPSAFLRDLRSICRSNARVFIEVPMFEWAIASGDFTSFTEQHVSYFSKASIESILLRVGLRPLTFTVAPNAWSDAWLVECCLDERFVLSEKPIDREVGRRRFTDAMKRAELFLRQQEDKGGIAVFGALCRTSNLLRYTGTSDGAVSTVFDDNLSLSGKRLYGTRLVVRSGAELQSQTNSTCLIAAINHEEKIERVHAHYPKSGGRFLRLIDILAE